MLWSLQMKSITSQKLISRKRSLKLSLKPDSVTAPYQLGAGPVRCETVIRRERREENCQKSSRLASDPTPFSFFFFFCLLLVHTVLKDKLGASAFCCKCSAQHLIADVTALIVYKLKVPLVCHYAHRASVAADLERDALQLHNNNGIAMISFLTGSLWRLLPDLRSGAWLALTIATGAPCAVSRMHILHWRESHIGFRSPCEVNVPDSDRTLPVSDGGQGSGVRMPSSNLRLRTLIQLRSGGISDRRRSERGG